MRGAKDNKSEFARLFEERGMKGYDKGPSGDKNNENDINHSTTKFGSFRKTKSEKNQFEPDLKLDLHGKTVVEALEAMVNFLDSARKGKFRALLVICGKGNNSLYGQAKLRPAITTKLVQLKTDYKIKDFEIAQPKHGGYGALYVYL